MRQRTGAGGDLAAHRADRKGLGDRSFAEIAFGAFSGQQRARPQGKAGISGIPGILESVSYC
jgi:hypothetical protein